MQYCGVIQISSIGCCRRRRRLAESEARVGVDPVHLVHILDVAVLVRAFEAVDQNSTHLEPDDPLLLVQLVDGDPQLIEPRLESVDVVGDETDRTVDRLCLGLDAHALDIEHQCPRPWVGVDRTSPRVDQAVQKLHERSRIVRPYLEMIEVYLQAAISHIRPHILHVVM